jgi:molybdopterin molybdotransferase
MISVSQATALIEQQRIVPVTKKISISDAVGHVLATPVTSDRDLPPYHRATMDGIAINSKAFVQGQRRFTVTGIQAAGDPGMTLSDPSHAIEIMTGAVVPGGCDTVIRYEDLAFTDGTAHVQIEDIAAGQNIHLQGMDAKAKEVLLEPGQFLSAADIAVLASVGVNLVDIYQFPSVAIVSTGNELVPIEEKPLPHQVRRSNGAALQAALQKIQCPSTLIHLQDDTQQLKKELEKMVNDFQIIILTGGVSKGKFDYVPEVLMMLGVHQQFHHVSQRPGKPLWFGTSPGKAVFALPGNPVSTFMCFYRYIQPWLLRCMHYQMPQQQAVLAHDFTFNPNLTYFLQVKVKNEKGKLLAYPDAGGGSGDFVNLKNITGFLELPLEKNVFKAGEDYPYFSFR